MAPTEFHQLLESQLTDIDVKNEVYNLLARKMAGDELKEEPKIQLLNNFLKHKIDYYSEYIKSIDSINQPGTDLLNDLFRQTLREVWG